MAKPPREQERPAARRGGAAKPVGALLPDVGGVAFRRFGFVQGALIGRWREVVGPVYARWSVPESIRFQRGEKHGGTLTIRVEGPFVTQLQHVSPQLIERVNRIFGYAAVAKVRLVQGPVPQPAERTSPLPEPAPGTTDGPNLSGIQDEGLRTALEGLAAQISATRGPPKIG
jgi:hypothetical protein